METKLASSNFGIPKDSAQSNALFKLLMAFNFDNDLMSIVPGLIVFTR